jgi:hypothetical protein
LTDIEQPGMELVIPMTGELISRDDPASCARALYEIKELEAKLKLLRNALSEVLLEESYRVGGKTLHFHGGVTAKIGTPADISWDYHILAELINAGLPAERFEALVQIEQTFKVNGSVVKEIEGANPVYAEIIGRARTRVPRTPTVGVTTKKSPA